MAGKHRNRRVQGYSDKLLLRIPPALKADLQDAALSHGISMNEEIVRRLMGPQRAYRSGVTREQWNALMELEPGPDDERTLEQIGEQMRAIIDSPDSRETFDRPLSDAQVDAILVSVEVLPGSLPFSSNGKSTRESQLT